MGSIYKITNLINGKIYIGLTTNSIQRRWKEHIQTAFQPNSQEYNNLLKKAIRKYGVDNFSIEEIESISNQDPQQELKLLKEREKYWIWYYNSFYLDNPNGYNMTRGGDSPTHELSLIPIKRVDILTGEMVEHCKSIAEAERKYQRGIHEIIHHISNAEIPKGYTWLRENEEYNQIEIFLRYNIICQFDLDGNFLQYWLHSQDAANNTGHSCGNINACLVEARDEAGGYQWCYYKNFDSKNHHQYHHKVRSKAVAQYDQNDNFIAKYDSLKEASEATGALVSKISSCCHGKNKITRGFKWAFWEDENR